MQTFYFEEIPASRDFISNFDEFRPEALSEKSFQRLLHSNRFVIRKTESFQLRSDLELSKPEISYQFTSQLHDPGPLFEEDYRLKSRLMKFFPTVKFIARPFRKSAPFSKANFFNVGDSWIETDDLEKQDFETTELNSEEFEDLSREEFEIFVQPGVENNTKFYFGVDGDLPSIFFNLELDSLERLISQIESKKFQSISFTAKLPQIEITDAPFRVERFGNEMRNPVFVPNAMDFEEAQSCSISLRPKIDLDKESSIEVNEIQSSRNESEKMLQSIKVSLWVLVFVGVLNLLI